MPRQRKPARIRQADWDDVDVPELTGEDFRRMRPASEVLPEQIGAKAAARLLRPRGRPRKAKVKTLVTMRLDPEILRHFRARGPGWQTRINAALKRVVARSR